MTIHVWLDEWVNYNMHVRRGGCSSTPIDLQMGGRVYTTVRSYVFGRMGFILGVLERQLT